MKVTKSAEATSMRHPTRVPEGVRYIMQPARDRRCRRASSQHVALRYFLEIAALKLGFKALVLGDGAGRLVAASGPGMDCEMAARSAPAIFRLDEPFPGDLMDPYFVEVLPASDETFFLLAVGQGSPVSLKSSGTLTGIRRILKM